MPGARQHADRSRTGPPCAAALVSTALCLSPVATVTAASSPSPAGTPAVLRVGTWHGAAGPFTTIQSAVNAAAPGDWVLVAPGDWRETGASTGARPAGVLVTIPGIHVRGMDRNGVVLDGTRATAAAPCAADPAAQDLGPGGVGRDGIVVDKVDGVSIENLTVCNFLAGGGGAGGNQIWWNGGDGSGSVGLGALSGAYLTASSSYDYATDPANTGQMAMYGIFTSNAGGPAVIAHTYVSNMGDSGYYIGACADCNVDITDAHAQNSSLGYSGTNAGGHLVIEHSEWDGNRSGLAPNSLNNDDWPSPADGACPRATGSCSVIRDNRVHDNSNQNAPASGASASLSPPGTGILLSGARNYAVTGNTITGNAAFGVLIDDYPDRHTTPPQVTAPCRGGTDVGRAGRPLCYYAAFGNEVSGNTFGANGGDGNAGNGDIAVASAGHAPGNCVHDNVDTRGALTTDPTGLQQAGASCGAAAAGTAAAFAALVCTVPGATAYPGNAAACPPSAVPGSYPAPAAITFLPIPRDQPSMPDPCAGVPANPWCLQNPDASATTPAPTRAPSPTRPAASAPASRPPAPVLAAAAVLVLGAGTGSLAMRRRRRRRPR